MKAMILIFGMIAVSIPLGLSQDVATEHTQILNNIELITENLRQLQSLYNQVTMIQNQVEGLKSVATYQNNFNDTDALRHSLSDFINQGILLSNQTQALLESMQNNVNSVTGHQTLLDQETMLGQGTMTIVGNALRRVALQRQSYQQEMNAVNGLVDKNNQAVGQTQALQTLNQMTAQIIPQMQLMRDLLSEQIALQAAAINKENQEKENMANTMDQIIHPVDNAVSSFNLGN